jgi:hypothetical protein
LEGGGIMGYGLANEYIAYAILDLARNETRKYLKDNGTYIINQQVEDNVEVTPQEMERDNRKLIAAVLTTLESNNFKLKLNKNALTGKLDSILINFDENVKQLIELVRMNNKLASVVVSVFTVSDSMYTVVNPFNMPTEVFVQYMLNKYSIVYYTEVIANPESTPEEVTEAQEEIERADLANQNLRSLYGVLVDSYSYDALVQFLPNPLGMEERDFVTYMLNKKIWILHSEGLGIPADVLEQAIEDNARLRDTYRIERDLYHYDQLKEYLPNPLGMTTEDFFNYYDVKKINFEEYEEIMNDPESTQEEIADVLEQAALREQPFKDKYFLVEDMDYAEMTAFIQENEIDMGDRLLFKIEVSLNYFMGKLETVESKMII